MRKPQKVRPKEEEDFINGAQEGPEVPAANPVEDKVPAPKETSVEKQDTTEKPELAAGTNPKQAPSKKVAMTQLNIPLPISLFERLKDEAWRKHKSRSQFLRDLIDKNCE